ncbi:MAG: pyrophosphatase [Rhodobacteraceae bacterium]|nr:MAG: pyrophosphatase [Paracoccaceae bacterium]
MTGGITDSLRVLTAQVAQVSDLYSQRFDICRDEFWHLAKLTEELGELTSVILGQTGRGRAKDTTESELNRQLEDEMADLLAHVLLLARHRDIDLEAALDRKWLAHLR